MTSDHLLNQGKMMDSRINEMDEMEAVLDARDALTPDNIHKTALDYMYLAFCTIRACAQEDPYRAGEIADAFHNLPRILHTANHQTIREETVRAVCILNANQKSKTSSQQDSLNVCNAGHGLAISPLTSAHEGLERL